MHVAALRVELHLRAVHSLKEKRAVIRPVLEGCRHRYSVAVAEVDHQERWQRATIGVAVVSGSAAHARQVLDAVERFIWSFPELEVSSCGRQWLDAD
ncbi:MAG: DUF503 domain-containing protein [Actinomycetota bacterium]|nr:DUF503 domain-containing protein [Actinomycetota bacterium]